MFDQDCIFCKIVQNIIPSKKYFEDDKFLVFFDIQPITENHLVIIAKNHYKDINEMSKEE